MKKNKVSLLVWLLVLLANAGGASAQNNPYKMDDRVWKIYLQARDSVLRPSCVGICDEMFRQALKLNDMMGQSIALTQKNIHYLNTRDMKGAKGVVNEARACKTIKLSYRFVIWKQYINQLLINGSTDEGYKELQQMQKEAVQVKSDYGIVKSHMMQGTYFILLQNIPAAIEQYRKGFELAGTDYKLYDYTEAANFAGLLQTEERFEEAVYYTQLGLSYPTLSLASKFLLKSRLLFIYSLPYYASGHPELSKEVKKELDELLAAAGKKAPALVQEQMYQNAMFHYCVNVEKKAGEAAQYLNSFSNDSVNYYSGKAWLEELAGRYKQAYQYAVKSRDLYVKQQKDNQGEVQKVYDLRSSLDESLRERDKLMLTNTQLLLDKSLQNERLLQLDAEAKEQQLHLNQTELQRQQVETRRQSEQMRHQQKELRQANENAQLMKQNMRWRWAFWAIGMSLVLVLFGVYALMHRQRERFLRSERDQAQQNGRMKSLFLQNMSHEIRTPLNAILGFNEILNNEDLQGLLEPGEREEFLGMIRMNADLLSTLVNDVLDISKFESGTYLINLTQVKVGDMCRSILETVRMRAQTGVEMRFEAGVEDLVLYTDAQRLQQVLINYLTNACKYTNKGSITLAYEWATVDAATEHRPELAPGKYVRFSVSDTGGGVPKGEEESCFTRFQMLDKNVKGTGLGLHICRLIAKMLHGWAYVDTSYTQGARFVFDHPFTEKKE